MKDLKNYLHYYMGCSYWTDNSQGEVNSETIRFIYPMIEKNKGVQLHLRRLSDISNEEWNEIECETSLMLEAQGLNAVRDNFLIGTDDYRLGWEIVNEALIILRKRGVDVDGLIDAGQAVAVKQVNNQP